MSRRAMVCVVESERGTIDPATINCGNQSHEHITQAEARIRVRAGEVEWLKEPASRADKSIVRVLKEKPRYRGLSAEVGETLATAVQNQELWAQVMLAEIRN